MNKELYNIIPKKYHSELPNVVKLLDDMKDNPALLDTFKDNLLGYSNILQNSRYSLLDYTNAVRFVTYKLLGHTDIKAYKVVFFDKYDRLVKLGKSDSEIGAYVSAYKKGKLPTQLLEQTLVPTHIVNAPLHQQSINELLSIGLNGKSEMARVQALGKVADLTKMPDNLQISSANTVNSDGDIIADYEQAIRSMVIKQQELIKQGADVKSIANASIKTEATTVEVIDESKE